MPICAKCKKNLPSSAFSKPNIDKKGRIYKRSYCKECNRNNSSEYGKQNREKRNLRLKEWREKSPIQTFNLDKRKRLQKRYGISLTQYEKLKERCQGKCSLCGQETKFLELDHDHKTKRIRGFLCRKCNLLLGLIESGNISLNQIAIYLQDKNGNPVPCHADVLLKFLKEASK